MTIKPPIAPVSQIGGDVMSLDGLEQLHPELLIGQDDEPPRDCGWLPKPEVIVSGQSREIPRSVDLIEPSDHINI